MASAWPTYSFQNITTNNVANAATGSQYTVEVVGTGSYTDDINVNVLATQTLFVFRNDGPYPSAISEVYFDDGALLGIASVINGPNVAFSQGANPGNLPGGNAINFNTTSGFLASSDPGNANSVHPGQVVGILFNLVNGKTHGDVLAALQLGFENLTTDVSGALRIGIHVRSIDAGTGESSESFVANVPEPSSLAIAGLSGLAFLGYGLRRRQMMRH